MELTFNFAVGGVFPYEVAGLHAVLLGAGAGGRYLNPP